MLFDNYGLMQQESSVAEVNMAPLIDMVFILLIFFIVTTNFNRQTGVDVTKPKAQTAVSTGQKTLLIGITREGTVHAMGRQVSIDRLKTLVAQEVAKRPDVSVVIIADRDVGTGRTVEVMDQCAQGGALKVAIAADKD